MSASVPAYFERIVASYHDGNKNRCAHLGHWDSVAEEITHSGSTETASPPLISASEFQAAQQRLDEQMIRLAQLNHGQSVLDVGCGLGGLIERINEHWSGMELTGLNVDPEQLDICHRIRPQPGNSLRWQEGDACQLPFEDQIFDRVFCVEAMFHFPSRRNFLAEVLRVLKPGGRFVASDIVLLDVPHVESFPRFAVAAILSDGYGPWPDPWCHHGSMSSLCDELGFRELTRIDATSNTLPTYDFIVPHRFDDDHDPGDSATRAALMLRWLHRSSALRYDYFAASKSY
jgi:SAM-dependent methyltransferase